MSGKKKSKKIPKLYQIQDGDKVTFDIFFDKKVKQERLFFYQKNEILTFFTEKGLSTFEDQDKYEEILKLF